MRERFGGVELLKFETLLGYVRKHFKAWRADPDVFRRMVHRVPGTQTDVELEVMDPLYALQMQMSEVLAAALRARLPGTTHRCTHARAPAPLPAVCACMQGEGVSFASHMEWRDGERVYGGAHAVRVCVCVRARHEDTQMLDPTLMHTQWKVARWGGERSSGR